jgi:hypothetical protein
MYASENVNCLLKLSHGAILGCTRRPPWSRAVLLAAFRIFVDSIINFIPIVVARRCVLSDAEARTGAPRAHNKVQKQVENDSTSNE